MGALFAAGVGTVAGRQAMLFSSSGKSSGSSKTPAPKKFTPKKTADTNRSANRSAPYGSVKNISQQKNGFSNFLQKFQLADGKSKYGVPIFLPNGAVNPAYLAAERKEQQAQSKKNTKML